MTKSTDNSALTGAQISVLAVLLSGQTTTQAADAAGVHRSTIHRWLHEPQFIAELNRGLAELRDAARNRLMGLHAKALDVVEAALGEGDLKAALEVLRGTGLLNGSPIRIGPTDPAVIDRQQRQQQADEGLLELMTEIDSGLLRR